MAKDDDKVTRNLPCGFFFVEFNYVKRKRSKAISDRNGYS